MPDANNCPCLVSSTSRRFVGLRDDCWRAALAAHGRSRAAAHDLVAALRIAPVTRCRGGCRQRAAERSGWTVDPPDGTHEYGEGADWAVHVALWQDGAVVGPSRPRSRRHARHRTGTGAAATVHRTAPAITSRSWAPYAAINVVKRSAPT
jgi:3'-phosphoadenosine 5'-phosphosulfate (PAPS) 3'-phosphatase